jgi:hypothetical protein
VGKNPAAECGLQLHVIDLVLVEKASITTFGGKWKTPHVNHHLTPHKFA